MPTSDLIGFRQVIVLLQDAVLKMGEDDQDGAAPAEGFTMEDMIKTLLTTVKQNADLIVALNNHAAGLSAEAIRAEKLAKLNLALRKSTKVKEYKNTQEMSIKEWLKKYEQEILVLKRMSGIDDDLTNTESVQMLKDKLDYHVIKRVDTAFKNGGYSWDTITYANLQKVLKEEFGGKVAEVCEVLIQFGPNRLDRLK